MVFRGQDTFEPAPTATFIHAYNSDGVSLPTLTDEEIWKVMGKDFWNWNNLVVFMLCPL